MNKKVTIIIPVYNGQNYLKEAIESALAQTYKNKEIIVVNDGSNDKTAEIAKSFGKKIKYYEKENGGVATALNLGIEKMTGDYFSWLSHDDLYYPNKLERQISFLENYKDKDIILYSDYSIIDSEGNKKCDCIKEHDLLQKKPYYGLLRGNINGITLLIPKEAFKKCGMFNVNLKCTQDYDLWFKMYEKYKFIHQPEVLAMTRIHSTQDSQISPYAIKEGNELWKKLADETPLNIKKSLEKTTYKFYLEMSNFLKTTPYEEAMKYTLEKATKIRENFKMKEELVSVIIPFYNNEDETINAIESVLNQTYKKIEIILIDDCSTKSIEKLKKYIKGKEQIHYYLNNKNTGPAGARNLGLKKCTGKYISLLDSDDILKKDKIQKQLFEMQLNKSEFSYTDYIEKKEDIIKNINAFTNTSKGNNELITNCRITTPTIMIERSFLAKNNIKYNEDYKLSEDACFYLECNKYCELLHIPNMLTIVNVNSKNCKNNIDNQVTGLKNIIRYVLNDDYYKEYDKEILTLFSVIINLKAENIEKKENIDNICDKDTSPFIRKLWRKLPIKFRKKLKKILRR